MSNGTVMVDGVSVKVGAEYLLGRTGVSHLIGHKSQARLFIEKVNGHFAIGRTCTVCRFGITLSKERYPGRGWGMREGNKLRGQMIQHIKQVHPEVIGKVME